MGDVLEYEHEYQEREYPRRPAAEPPRVGKEAIRRSIADLARTFVRAGHYLEGTAGCSPGNPDGNPGGGKRQNCGLLPACLNTDLTQTEKGKVISVCTGVQEGAKGYNTCAGRPTRYVQPPDNRAALAVYLPGVKAARARTRDQAFWPGLGSDQLHPRRFFFQSKLGAEGRIVWGESCVGRRHFDCVGLVNFCYEEHTTYGGKAGWCWEISQYLNGTAGTSVVAVKPDLSNVMDGDIFCRIGRHEHIGLLYRDGGKVFMIQAEQTSTGLTDNELFEQGKGTCVRVKDQLLVPRKHKLTDGNGR
jgi:hypothetical protein